jgi:hypothetical protein
MSIISQYPKSLEVADMFCKDRSLYEGENPCPDWCAMPSSIMASLDADSIKKQAAVFEHYQNNPLFDLTAAILWSRNKMIYRFDSTLEKTLATQSIEGNIPTEALNYLPYPCVYIERDMNVGGYYDSKGFFAWLDWNDSASEKLLRLHFLCANNICIQAIVPIIGNTIQNSLLRVSNKTTRGRNSFTPEIMGQSQVLKAYAECVNLLLYLCSENPDMPDDAELRSRRSRDYHGNPKRSAAWDVGIRIGAALRKIAVPSYKSDNYNDEEPASNTKEKTSKRPHMRRAHWHSYWIGKRNSPSRKLILRWLPPTGVNLDEKGLPTVISPVKSSDIKEGVSFNE